MIDIKEKESCTGCGACQNICPKDCITMKEDEYGFRYPYIHEDNCIGCNLCESVCPMIKNKSIKEFKPSVYACQIKDENIRKKSSSGGIFSSLALQVLYNNGVVYGAAFDIRSGVMHLKITSIDDLYLIRGSKYLQSDIAYSYKDIKQLLLQNIPVLFSGTGCQIAGLKNYLNKDYDNLLTVEVVCHGVPSEMIFSRYKEELEKEYNSEIKTINFRDKIDGWNNYSISVLFENDIVLSQKSMDNDFMRGYIHNLYLRPSCKTCHFKSMSSGSDILLGDFWGVNELGEPWNDNKGTSVVFINTEKGIESFDFIKNQMIYKEVDLDFSTRFNPCIVRPVEHSHDIYDELNTMSLHDIIEKYKPQPQKQQLLNKIKNKIIGFIKKVS